MPKFRKKPIVIESIQWTGRNEMEIADFIGGLTQVRRPTHIHERELDDIPNEAYTIIIPTLEGDMTASRMDWIIKGVNGEFYPCKPDIFEKTYEPVD